MEQRGCRRAADAPSAVNGRPQAESIDLRGLAEATPTAIGGSAVKRDKRRPV
jgi:hypothetical protein